MIKISVDIQDFGEQYWKSIKGVVILRIESAIHSLKHLQGAKINVDEDQFISIKSFTKEVVTKFNCGALISSSEFNKDKYEKTVSQFNSSSSSINLKSKIDIDELLRFLDSLLELNNLGLKKLLTCSPEKLYDFQDELIKNFNLNLLENIFIIKLTFNFDLNVDINSKIKSFFRTNNIVNACPYCNYYPAKFKYTPNESRTAAAHQLDHFFDKADFPLLSYSVFNLIPSDSTCNGSTKKGSIRFSDKYHLNPYISGFTSQMNYLPIELGGKVKEIELNVKAPLNSDLRNQMLGSTQQINEDIRTDKKHQQGNINVFTLKTLYNDETAKAENIIQSLYRANNGFRGIKMQLNALRGIDLNEIYKRWYSYKIKTPFEPDNFNKEIFSKFNRDIHDYYYLRDNRLRNKFIRDLIEKFE